MSIELAIGIWLFCVLYATGSLDNLAAKGIAALFRTPPKRSATRSRLNRESATRPNPSRSGGHIFTRFVFTCANRVRPVRTTKQAVADGQTFFMDTVEMEWRK